MTTEQPRYEARFGGITLEYEILPSLLVGVTGRYYTDTGEIENGLPVTSAAPPLDSWEAGASLRWIHGRSTLKVYAAPFWTDYDRRPGFALDFYYLYSDRNWGLAQIAWEVQF
jgi:hypothetical protein